MWKKLRDRRRHQDREKQNESPNELRLRIPSVTLHRISSPSGRKGTARPPLALSHCPAAWECLAVGAFDEACRLSHIDNDVICWAASLAMSGQTSMALKTMEAFIIAACVVMHEKRLRPEKSDEHFARRVSEIMVSWVAGPKTAAHTLGRSTTASPEEYHAAALDASGAMDWDSIHRWFIIALFLHEEEYEVPSVLWFRYFFALFPRGNPLICHPRGRLADRKKLEVTIDSLTENDVEDILLAQCAKWDLYLISAITAWKRQHYRTAITMTTSFLAVEEGDMVITDVNMVVMMRFIRCLCLIQIGERAMAAEDAVTLLQHEKSLFETVGASLSAFLLPLPQAIDIVTTHQGTIMMRRYVYALCEYIHALTLVQLGSMEAAIKVIETAICVAPINDVGEWLCDLLVIACTALEDSTTILRTPLSPQRQLYIAMCPAFFGGFGSGYARVRTSTPAGRLLYPKYMPTYASLRQRLPFHLNRAHHHVSQHMYMEAWSDVCVAVGCAEEIIGSVEFAFTTCSPINVYTFGCRVGMRLLHMLLQISTKPLSSDDFNNAVSTEKEGTLLAESNALGEEVIKKCGEWAKRIRHFHPNVRLGSVIRSEQCTIAREEHFISRAIYLARRYPHSVLSQNCLTEALYANHHIPEAVDNAAKVLQEFPHSPEVIALQREVQPKNGIYIFNYRTLLPVRYAPGSNRVWTKRAVIVVLLLLCNFAIVLVTTLCNMSNWINFSESSKELVVRLQLPSEIPLLFAMLVIIYSLLAAVSPRNLLRTIMQDIFFCDTRFNRFLFGLRGLAFVNVFNALQITIAGNNFLFDSHWYTALLYIVLTILFVPFTTRVWFLPSIDEPKVGLWTWLTILAIDTVTAFIVLIPHLILIAFEPFMFIIFFFFLPVQRPDSNSVSGNIGKRLQLHQTYIKRMPSRYTASSGSRFIHVRIMSFLYYATHSDLDTMFAVNAQMEEDNYRVFPLIEVYERISIKPIERTSQRKRQGIQLKEGEEGEENVTNDDLNTDPSYLPSRRHATYYVSQSPSTSSTDDDKHDDIDLDHNHENRSIKRDDASNDSIPNYLNSITAIHAEFHRRFSCELDSNLSSSDEDETHSKHRSHKSDTRRETKANDDHAALCSSHDEGGEDKDDKDVADKKKEAVNDNNSNSPHSPAVQKNAPTMSNSLRLRAVKGQGQHVSHTEVRKHLAKLADSYRGSILASTLGSNPLHYSSGNHRGTDSSGSNRNRRSDDDDEEEWKPYFDPFGVIFPRSLEGSEGEQAVEASDTDTVESDETLATERPFLKALQDLHHAFTTRCGDSNNLSVALPLRRCKETVETRLVDLCAAQKRQMIEIRDRRCLELCSRVFVLLVEDGDNPARAVATGNVALVEQMMSSINAMDVFRSALMQNALLEHCVLSGFSEMLRAVLPPRCVERLGVTDWEGLLQSFQWDTVPLMSESLCVVLDASETVTSTEIRTDIMPLFQKAVHAALIAGASKLSRVALDTLLRRIQFHSYLRVDFWQVEDENAQTIFSKACAVGDEQLVDAMWTMGLVADPNRVQRDGMNALMQAVVHERLSVVKWFCNVGMDVFDSFIYKHPHQGNVLNMSRITNRVDDGKDKTKKMMREAIREAMNRMDIINV